MRRGEVEHDDGREAVGEAEQTVQERLPEEGGAACGERGNGGDGSKYVDHDRYR